MAVLKPAVYNVINQRLMVQRMSVRTTRRWPNTVSKSVARPTTLMWLSGLGCWVGDDEKKHKQKKDGRDHDVDHANCIAMFNTILADS